MKLILPETNEYSVDAKVKIGDVSSEFGSTTQRQKLLGAKLTNDPPSSARRLFLRVGIGEIEVAKLKKGESNVSGTWNFSVDLEDGGHGEPTFVFKQEGENLSDAYTGPLGEQKVTGTVKGDKAVFGFEFTRDGESLKATYTGTIETPAKMTGTVDFSGQIKGKWIATKKVP